MADEYYLVCEEHRADGSNTYPLTVGRIMGQAMVDWFDNPSIVMAALEPILKCPLCTLEFLSFADYLSHWEEAHEEKKNYGGRR